MFGSLYALIELLVHVLVLFLFKKTRFYNYV